MLSLILSSFVVAIAPAQHWVAQTIPYLPATDIAQQSPSSQQTQPQSLYPISVFPQLEGQEPYCASFNLRDVAVSPDSRRIAISAHTYQQSVCGGGQSTLLLWDLETGQPISTLITGGVAEIFANFPEAIDPDFNELGGDLASAIAFTPDSRTLIGGMADTTVRLWNAETGQVLRSLTGHTGAVRAIAVSPDSRTVFSGSADGTMRVWDVQTGRSLQVLTETNAVRHLIMSPDGNHLATIVAGSALGGGTVHLWRKAGDRWQRVAWEQTFPAELPDFTFRTRTHWDIANVVQFALGGSVLVTGDAEGTIRLWNADTGARMRTLQRHRDAVNHLQVTADGQFLASYSDDGETLFWNLPTGQWIRTVPGLGRPLSFTGDGRFLLTQSETRLLLWNWRLPEPQVVTELNAPGVTLAPDNRTFITQGVGNRLQVWR